MRAMARARSLPASARAVIVAILFPVLGFAQGQPTQQASAGAPAARPGAAAPDTGAMPTAAPAKVEDGADDSFVIGADDVLAVNVWKETEISRTLTVRPDGKISLPLLGDLQASGKSPKALQQEISGKLAAYISEPEVTVIVQEIRSHRFNVLGLVQHPGSYLLTNSATVLDAIALAGGFRDFAKQRSIYVLRSNPDGSKTRLGFNYKEVIKGNNPEQNVTLQPRDTIVVP